MITLVLSFKCLELKKTVETIGAASWNQGLFLQRWKSKVKIKLKVYCENKKSSSKSKRDSTDTAVI